MVGAVAVVSGIGVVEGADQMPPFIGSSAEEENTLVIGSKGDGAEVAAELDGVQASLLPPDDVFIVLLADAAARIVSQSDAGEYGADDVVAAVPLDDIGLASLNS